MIINLQGNYTVARSAELRELLMDALHSDEQKVTLHFAEVQDADLSFFQLVQAGRRSFEAAGKELVLHKDMSAELGRAACSAGMCGLEATAAEAVH